MRSTSILTIAGVTAAGGLLAYAVYFDYKRRTDVDFRKKLRKDKKRVDKSLAQSKDSASSSSGISPAELRDALEKVKKEEGPKTAEEKETYFMSQVGIGEQLALQGPDFYLPAALSFYRALRVYPSPVELIVIYQKTVPEPIFKIVMDMTNLDVKDRVEGYYEHFPPKSTNVSVESRQVTGGLLRKVLVANKDFKSGDIIYKEHPIVTALDSDLQAAGTHCTHCLRLIQSPMSINPPTPHTLPTSYCSKACLLSSKSQSHNLLFTLDPPLPPEIPAPPMAPQAIEARKNAQAKFVQYLQKEGRAAPLLLARFIARQVAVETGKMLPGGLKPAEDDFTGADATEYALNDHIERLRYLEVTPPTEERPLLVDVLQTALPGLEQFVTDERHATLLGKMAYNSYGVCFGGGRDDKPQPKERPEDVERSRTPYGTARQIGSALYAVSSYLTHSCLPSARPSFSRGTAELHLIANHDVKKGDELTVAFVDVTQRQGETVEECRRRRRMELARGWRFACTCQRCEEEGGGVSDGSEQKDESKVEGPVSRFEQREGGTGDVE